MILITKENLDRVVAEILSQGVGEYSIIVDSLADIQFVPKSVDSSGQIILLYEGDNNE